jgi:hypothetical protein
MNGRLKSIRERLQHPLAFRDNLSTEQLRRLDLINAILYFILHIFAWIMWGTLFIGSFVNTIISSWHWIDYISLVFIFVSSGKTFITDYGASISNIHSQSFVILVYNCFSFCCFCFIKSRKVRSKWKLGIQDFVILYPFLIIMLIRLTHKHVPSTCKNILYLYAAEIPRTDDNPTFQSPYYVDCGAYFAKNTTFDDIGTRTLSDYCDTFNGTFQSMCATVQTGFAMVILIMSVNSEPVIIIEKTPDDCIRIILIPMAFISWVTDHRNPIRDQTNPSAQAITHSGSLDQTNVMPLGERRISLSETTPPPRYQPADGSGNV